MMRARESFFMQIKFKLEEESLQGGKQLIVDFGFSMGVEWM
jgi:hypothetical protein